MKNKSLKQILPIILGLSFFVSLLGGGFGFLIFSSFTSHDLSQSQQLLLEKNIVTQTQEESATIDVVQKVSPSVVSIIVSKDLSDFQRNYRNREGLDDFFFFGSPFDLEVPGIEEEKEGIKQRIGGGTGFIISEEGLVLTNRHVVSDTDAEYTVVTRDGEEFSATVLGRDAVLDLAVVKIESEQKFPVADLGDSDLLNIGQTVIAIGYSLGEFKDTVTKGIVSGINRRVVAGSSIGQSEVIDEAIQTDAAINPGNSGGPLLDLAGNVIGINTAVSRSGQLIGFSIPINAAKNVINSVKEYGRIVRPFLGVRYLLLSPGLIEELSLEGIENGAYLSAGVDSEDSAIVEGSPADEFGLETGDVILEVDGEIIDLENPLARLIAKHLPGDKIELKVYRQGKILNIIVILEEFEDSL